MAPPDRAVTDQYIVVFHEESPEERVQEVASQVRGAHDDNRVLRDYSVIRGFSAVIDETTVNSLRSDPDIKYIEQDQRVQLDAVHNSPADGTDRIDQRLGHDGFYDDYGRTGAGVHVYILDTGINTQHSDFNGRIGNGADFINDGFGVEDCEGHGTHVASTAAGSKYGVARSAMIHPVRVLNCGGSGTWAGVIGGIDFAHQDCPQQNGPCVANMSLSGGTLQAVNDAVAAAVAGGVTFVVAAGNDNKDACTKSPASEPSAITVAATDDNDKRAAFSNFGACTDIFAPGVTILAAYIGSPTATAQLSGTSMASPHVAGAAALLLGSSPNLTPGQIEHLLNASASLECVVDPQGSPNTLLFTDFNQGNVSCAGPGPSCEGLCGGPGDGCFCDQLCQLYNDCCPDYLDQC